MHRTIISLVFPCILSSLLPPSTDLRRRRPSSHGHLLLVRRRRPRGRRRLGRRLSLPRPALRTIIKVESGRRPFQGIERRWKSPRLRCKVEGWRMFLFSTSPSYVSDFRYVQKKRLVIFYGSQTGTAEEYAIRIAKEAKSKFGLTSLVCDPEEYDFENIDTLPEDCAAIFVMATYGEGEPTDNAVQLMQNLADDSFEFSNGEHKLDGLKYVVFGLGNRTYEHYNVIAKQVDQHLSKMGATRIGERGEGDDDKSMEEDYLEWKDGMWEEFARVMGVEEGQGSDTADFAVNELESHPPEKVYRGK